MVVRKIWKRYLRWFDRAFSDGWIGQISFLSIIILFFVALWMLISILVLQDFPDYGQINRIVELMMDPGAFMNSDTGEKHDFPVVFSWIISISGVVLFTAMLITIIGNIVGNRIGEYKKGMVKYDFDDHILILGANAMLVNMLKEIAKDPILRNKKVVVLTKNDTELLQDSIKVQYPTCMRELDITFLCGYMELEESLKNVQVDEAYSIYILGEDDEIDHDSKNIKCWEQIQVLCSGIKHSISCYMVVDRLSSFHVFQYSNNEVNDKLNLTIVNSLESWAQRVLVARDFEKDKRYPSILGKPQEDYSKNVRFVIFGMTQMSYSMATTVAHLVHKPDFIPGTEAKKTKISFVLQNITQEMNFFKGHYEQLFKLSHAWCLKWNNEKCCWAKTKIATPDPEIGDFLDVEWEFIDGSIEDDNIRQLLVDYAESSVLSVAICNHNTESNIAASLYLPSELYDKEVPIFVYQPNEGNILKSANSTVKYKSIYPFGMKQDCYDPIFKTRLTKAKRINYLYHLENNGRPFIRMANNKEIEELWNENTSYALMYSNIYAANSIPMKLELLGIDPEKLMTGENLTEWQVEKLAEMEHNRWNMEKLMMGFQALPQKEREKLNRGIESGDENIKAYNKKLKAAFKHKDIAPYKELLVSSKNYDRAIVRNIISVINGE